MGIHIQDLKVPCVIGIYPNERLAVQDILLDINIALSGHPQALKTNAYFDYAGLSAAVTFYCRSAQFGLLEDALVAIDALIWSMMPSSWVSLATVEIKIKKPQALSSYGTPSLYSRTRAPSQKGVFVERDAVRIARLSSWEQGALWLWSSNGDSAVDWMTEEVVKVLLTSGCVHIPSSRLQPGQCIHAVSPCHLIPIENNGRFEALVYVAGTQAPQILCDSSSQVQLEYKKRGSFIRRFGYSQVRVFLF